MAKKIKFVLTIAGSDSSSGAGIQSDLKTFLNHGLYGLSVVTAVTAQNTLGVQTSFEIPQEMIEAQLKSIFDDFEIDAIKTGMLSSEKVVEVVSNYLRNKTHIKIIVDPVLVSKNGYVLLNEKGIDLIRTRLFPLSFLVTPNVPEAEILSGIKINTADDIESAAKQIFNYGCRNVLIKGGHMPESAGMKKGVDVLYNGKKFYLFKSKFIKSYNTHGIGCVFSAAVASNIALGGTIKSSIVEAKAYLVESLKKSQKIGKGIGPVEQV
jgi:hydroxymethylpyrimidine/phosphomethylpyrimidine kinase